MPFGMRMGMGLGSSPQVAGATAKASGGTESIVGGYHYHLFASGTPTLIVNQEITADYLIVGGGGGGSVGGTGGGGGGGGAGGVIWTTGATVSAGTYNISIGAGGPSNTEGSATTFNGLTALGGGQGGTNSGGFPISGTNSGSGGGGGAVSTDTTTDGGVANAPQGSAGGKGQGSTSQAERNGGGGGGYAHAGYDGAKTAKGGNGGEGIDLSAIIGTSFGLNGTFAGGGGGGRRNTTYEAGSGVHGGGNGANNLEAGSPGIANTGGGGGGGSYLGLGGMGGSGVVIVRYSTTAQ